MQKHLQDELSALAEAPTMRVKHGRHSTRSADVASAYYRETRDPSVCESSKNTTDRMLAAMNEYAIEAPQIKSSDHHQKQRHYQQSPVTSVSTSNMYKTTPQLMSDSSITSTDSTRQEQLYAAELLKQIALERKKKEEQRQNAISQKDPAYYPRQDEHQQQQQQQNVRSKLHVDTSTNEHQGPSVFRSTKNESPSVNSDHAGTGNIRDPYYALLQTGDSSLSQQLATPRNLMYNLSSVLKSSSEALSPINTEPLELQSRNNQQIIRSQPSPPIAEDEISLLSTPHSVKHNDNPIKGPPTHQDDSSVLSSSAGSCIIRSRLSATVKVTKEHELAYYPYVSKRSVLQLVTEDLMSEKWKLVDCALFRLLELCCNDDMKQETEQQLHHATANRIRFIKAGGHALIVGVMKKFGHIADIQATACRFIQNFLCRDREGAFSELLGSVDGIERIMDALQRFITSAENSNSDNVDARVHRYACGALTALVCSSMKMVQRLMNKPGNLRVFLDAMKVNMENNKEATGICRVLHFISTSAQFCNEIAATGGMEEIAREMRQYPQKQDVQVCGCGALANVITATKKPEVVEHLVGNLAGAQLIGAAMRTFPDLEKLQEKGVFAICVLSGFRNVQGAIKAASGLSALGIALESFPENKIIQEQGSTAMKRLLEAGK